MSALQSMILRIPLKDDSRMTDNEIEEIQEIGGISYVMGLPCCGMIVTTNPEPNATWFRDCTDCGVPWKMTRRKGVIEALRMGTKHD